MHELLTMLSVFLLLVILMLETKPRPLFAMAEEDDDIKIAPSGGFSTRPPEDASDVAAKKFLKQKESGNIGKARELGERYASVLLDNTDSEAIRCTDTSIDQHLCLHQRYVLYTYAVNRAVGDFSPDSLLAQTTLNVFYDTIEEQSPEIYRHVSDMAAFSLYILYERSRKKSNDDIGKVYAKLCDRESDKSMIEEGNALYQRFYRHCAQELEKVAYNNI